MFTSMSCDHLPTSENFELDFMIIIIVDIILLLTSFNNLKSQGVLQESILD